MNNEQMLDTLVTLPDPDMMTATKIDDPLGSGAYYRADNVARMLAKERETSDRLRAWVEEAIGYVESPMFSPSLADEGKALLTPNA